jgi:hypothetical protein
MVRRHQVARRKSAKVPATIPDLYTIDNLETLRLLTDPLRISIMQAFAADPGRPRTVKQIAAELSAGPTKLYYHVNLLEEHGLLRVADSRVVSGIIEKSYLPAARNFTIDASLLAVTEGGREAAAGTMAALLQTSASEIAASVTGTPSVDPSGAPRFHVTKSLSRIDPARHAEFMARIAALVDEFDNTYGSAAATNPSHALVIAYYPLPASASQTTDEGDDR